MLRSVNILCKIAHARSSAPRTRAVQYSSQKKQKHKADRAHCIDYRAMAQSIRNDAFPTQLRDSPPCTQRERQQPNGGASNPPKPPRKEAASDRCIDVSVCINEGVSERKHTQREGGREGGREGEREGGRERAIIVMSCDHQLDKRTEMMMFCFVHLFFCFWMGCILSCHRQAIIRADRKLYIYIYARTHTHTHTHTNK